jgi:peptidoglycan/xylan/chitin deacetylase (PgdA/CDA1 family)
MSDVLVLCYHAVSERWTALVERGYRGATFSEAVTSPPAPRTVAVTFDDGYRSVLERAQPIMSRLGLVGTVFVVTGSVGSERPLSWPGVDHWIGTEHERELVPLAREELGQLLEAGWEVGSHTRTHPHLTTLDDGELESELRGSREDCERLLGRPCDSLAYPYGDCDERVVVAAGRAGYRVAGALSSRLRAARPLEWPRIGIYYGDDDRRFRAKASPAIRRLRATSAFGAADRLRKALRR